MVLATDAAGAICVLRKVIYGTRILDRRGDINVSSHISCLVGTSAERDLLRYHVIDYYRPNGIGRRSVRVRPEVVEL